MTYTTHRINFDKYKWGVFEDVSRGLMVAHYETEAEARKEAARLNERKK